MHQGAPCNAHTLDINVVINWQLSKQGTRKTWAQVSTHWGQVFFWSYPLVTRFQMIAGSSLIFFKIHMKYVVFQILILNWPRTRKFSQLLKAGKTVAFDFAHHGHALVTLYVHFLCSDWSKFDRWVHAENLFSILNLVYFDSWSWQSFLSTCDLFNCLFPPFLTVLMYKMKFSCYQESSVIHG